MIHLRKATEEIMSENWRYIEKRFLKYYQEILANNELIIKYRQKFYMTGYLRAYINVTQAKSKSPEFSIRYGGQEVALMQFNKKEEIFYLHFNEKKHAKNNKNFLDSMLSPVTISGNTHLRPRNLGKDLRRDLRANLLG